MKSIVILIHTGKIFPIHINDCIENLLNFNIDVHFILSNKLHSNVKNFDIKLINVEDYIDDKYKTFKLKNHDLNYKDNFWERTSTRFFLLNNYVGKNNIENFFHIENDVLIFTDLISENQILNNLNYDMNIIIDSNERSIPSIIWVRNNIILNLLSEYIYMNNHNNDMRNLFLFYLENKDKVSNLPILPPNSNIRYNSNFNYSNNFEKFTSIFDGAAIGQYLGGIDNTDYDTIGYVSPDSIFDVSNFDYCWENGLPYMIHNEIKIKINNLHIHSKKLNKFKTIY
jgi:hypothetical protein